MGRTDGRSLRKEKEEVRTARGVMPGKIMAYLVPSSRGWMQRLCGTIAVVDSENHRSEGQRMKEADR